MTWIELNWIASDSNPKARIDSFTNTEIGTISQPFSTSSLFLQSSFLRPRSAILTDTRKTRPSRNHLPHSPQQKHNNEHATPHPHALAQTPPLLNPPTQQNPLRTIYTPYNAARSLRYSTSSISNLPTPRLHKSHIFIVCRTRDLAPYTSILISIFESRSTHPSQPDTIVHRQTMQYTSGPRRCYTSHAERHGV